MKNSSLYLCLWVIVIPFLLMILLNVSGFFDWLDCTHPESARIECDE